MKTSSKVTIGLSIAAIAGITTAVVVSDKVFNKVRFACNRHKVKKFVDDKFNGNEKLLDVVDGLSDNELDSLLGVMKKVNEGRNKIGDNIKDSTEHVKDKLTSFVDSVF